jgi:hypothetical protein
VSLSTCEWFSDQVEMYRRRNALLFLGVIILQLFEYANARVSIQEGVNLTVSAENSLHLHSERGSIIAQDDTEVLKNLRIHGELHLNESNVLSILRDLQDAVQRQQLLINSQQEIIQNLTDTLEKQTDELSKIGRGFTYKSVGQLIATGWHPIICNIFQFNDFGNDTYNTTSGFCFAFVEACLFNSPSNIH